MEVSRGVPEQLEGSHPLHDVRIAVTRPAEQAEGLADALRARGARPLICPSIRLEPVGGEALERAAARAGDYRWIVFTSANGVDSFFDRFDSPGNAAALGDARIAAIGPATARAVARRGVRVDLVPERYVGEEVAAALIAADDLSGARVLLPRAEGARAVLPERLRAAGAEVDVVSAYASRPDPEGIARLREAIGRGEVDVVTFTAASTVRSYVELASPDFGGARVAVIGPITAAAAREAGVEVDVVAREYTISGLVEALCRFYGDRGGGR